MPLKQLVKKIKPDNGSSQLMAIYSAMLLLYFHLFLVQYINSSFLEQFISTDAVGPMYIIGSSFTVFIFLFISRVLKKVGNYKSTMILLAINAVSVLGMALTDNFSLVIPFFMAHIITVPLIFFNLDVFLEAIIGNKESSTGSKRGLLLAFISFIGAISPLLTGLLVDENSFSLAYLVSLLPLLSTVMIMFGNFRWFQDPKYKEIRLMRAIHSFWSQDNIRLTFLSHLLLRVFFTYMVIYAPLYLATEIGLSWGEIGVIIFGGQIAYMLFEYPVGYLADAKIGEKEMMSAGFVILAVSIPLLSAIESTSIWPWIIALFIMRTGASFVEVTTESYFFKQTKSSDAQIISFFRLTRPLSTIVGATLGGLSMLYLPFNMIFVVLGFFMIFGILFAATLEDTK